MVDTINIAFITTLDEVVDKELVGKEVIDPETNISLGNREGTLSSIAKSISSDCNFGKKFNLTCIIINDDVEDVKEYWKRGEGYDPNFIVKNQSGDKTLKDITKVIPSSVWRKVPIPPHGSDDRRKVLDERKKLKEEYETRICDALHEAKVDLLVSNSYTNIIGHVLLDRYRNRIINIHPAITSQEDPCRLPGITPTRDAYTRALHGFVIVDDKKSVSLDGEESIVNYKNEERKVVKFDEKYRYTHGVTVHVITKGVDEGPPILTKKYDLRDQFNISESDASKPLLTEERIRDYNYSLKPSVLIEAIKEYSSRDQVQTYIKEGRKYNQ